ncbi:DUF7269 family protein [Natronomonas marina]|jgi:hypothetical protein|uniref:DUF7269 family protein n=1 Tax=Natronomonas marina TaxID=2961939 RepID=UPI0020C95F26|nr:hypothetical protein [Natronomonas marina]
MRRLALLGIAAVAVGALTLVERGLAGFFQLDYLFVSAVGVLAVVFGLRYALAGRWATRWTAEIESPEPRYRSTVLGEEVETALGSGGQLGIGRRAELRRRLRDVAADVLVTYAGYDREGAETAVEEGTWTDDPVAAGYLAEPIDLPRRLQVRNLLRRRSMVRTCVERSLTAIEEVREP